MSRNTLTMAVAVTILLVAPIAGAKWMSFGTYEPDTSFDTSKYMVQDGPGLVANKTVYFNAYMSAAGSNIVLNSGELETSLDPFIVPFARNWKVIMGVWTDCNGDGYVGLAETAAMEYHARVLTTPLSTAPATLCPAKTGAATAYGSAAVGMPNNYNSWVTEFIAIGGVDYIFADDARVLYDPEAMVWAERGIPDARVGAPPAPSACKGSFRGPPNDQESGDAHSLGGMLWFRDCQGNRDVSIVKTFNEVDATAGTGLGFGNDPKNSTSPLNVKFGTEKADSNGAAAGGNEAVIVRAQDCGPNGGSYGENGEATGDPELLNSDSIPTFAGSDRGNLVLLRAPPANPVSTDTSKWSVPATYNYTLESAPETPSGEPGDGPSNERDCNFDNDQGRDFYEGQGGGLVGTPAFEGNPITGQIEGKVTAFTNLRFTTAQRGSLPGNGIAPGNGGADPNLGIPLINGLGVASNADQTIWTTGADMAPQDETWFARVDLDAPETSGLPNSKYATFYGYVGTAIKNHLAWWTTTPNAGEKYGNQANSCDGQTSGVKNNWVCDPAKWYLTADGQPVASQPLWCFNEPPCPGRGQADVRFPLARVHQEYTFRDVDCWDGRVGSTGVVLQPSGLSAATACKR